MLAAPCLLIAAEEGPPLPEKADTPYLVHATTLIPTEQAVASEEQVKKELYYIVPGAQSPVRTPLALPEFVYQAESVDPRNFRLYRLESEGGRRQLLFQKKDKILAKPIYLDVFPVEDQLYRIRVDRGLEQGEYCLSPDGSNDVFCFAVQ